MIVGALDAYTYLEHGAVFAGLQTGNLILLGINLGHLQLATMGRYLTALLAFACGAALTRVLQRFLEKRRTNLQNVALWLEFGLLILVLATTSIIPDWGSTALLALAASVALQEFRRLRGEAFAPFMMAENLRATMVAGFKQRDRESRVKTTETLALVGSFIMGAILVGAFDSLLKGYGVLIPILLVVGLISWLYQENHRRKWKH